MSASSWEARLLYSKTWRSGHIKGRSGDATRLDDRGGRPVGGRHRAGGRLLRGSGRQPAHRPRHELRPTDGRRRLHPRSATGDRHDRSDHHVTAHHRAADHRDAHRPPTTTTTEPPALTVAAGGDVLGDRRVGNFIDEHGGEAVFAKVEPFLETADLAFVNLEGPISDKGTQARLEGIHLPRPPGPRRRAWPPPASTW